MPALPNLLLRPWLCRIWAIWEAAPAPDPKWHLVYVFYLIKRYSDGVQSPGLVRGPGWGNLAFSFVLFGLKRCELVLSFSLMTYLRGQGHAMPAQGSATAPIRGEAVRNAANAGGGLRGARINRITGPRVFSAAVGTIFNGKDATATMRTAVPAAEHHISLPYLRARYPGWGFRVGSRSSRFQGSFWDWAWFSSFHFLALALWSRTFNLLYNDYPKAEFDEWEIPHSCQLKSMSSSCWAKHIDRSADWPSCDNTEHITMRWCLGNVKRNTHVAK